jgi:hypothetical protein
MDIEPTIALPFNIEDILYLALHHQVGLSYLFIIIGEYPTCYSGFMKC